MPTKVVNAQNELREWPSDFERKIKDTITGKNKGKDGFKLEGVDSIPNLADRSQRSTIIEFDEGSFSEEGLKKIEQIEDTKILDLVMEGGLGEQTKLIRSRIYDKVKDYTLEDMKDKTKRLEIIGYSLYGKRRSDEDVDLDSSVDIEEYIRGFEDIPQRAEIGQDIPHVPLSRYPEVKNPKNNMSIKFNRTEEQSTGTVHIFDYTGDVTFEYSNTDNQKKFLQSLYPNVQYKNAERNFTQEKGDEYLIGTLEEDIEPFNLGSKPTLSDVAGKLIDEIVEEDGSLEEEMVSAFEEEILKRIVEASRGQGLKDEKFRVTMSPKGQLRVMEFEAGESGPTFSLRSDIKYGIKIQNQPKGMFSVSPFAYEYRGKKKGNRTEVGILSDLYGKDAPMYRGAIEMYNQIPDELEGEDREAVLQEIGEKFKLKDGEIQESQIQDAIARIEEGMKDTSASEDNEYRLNEPLSDKIDQILHNYFTVKEQIEEGA